MGLGNSKFNAAEGEVVSAKIRPMLVGRFEEFKKRREDTPSKKKLLKDADEENDNSQSSRQSETEYKVSFPREIQPPREETVVQAITAEKLSRVVPVPNSERKIVENNHLCNIEKVSKDMDPNQDKDMVKTEEGKTAEPKREKEPKVCAKGDDHDDNSDDEDESEEIGRLLYPGSPSFRIYCIEAEKINDEECISPTIVVHQKSRSTDSVERAASRNLKVEVETESESTTKRKGNKKKFGVVRTLLKVKSCYHPIRACTGDDRNLIVTAKAAK